MAKAPLALYIHWPFCKSKCPYCDFNSHVRDRVEQERWRQALLAELGSMAAHVPGRELTSIFFGGGTPSLMPPSTAAALIERAQNLWPVSPDIEITLEANPTSVEMNTFADFAKAGVNRVSLGVQSLETQALEFLGREHSAAEALRAVERAKSVFKRFSFDLIYARPDQTLEAWEKELTQALQHADGHLSLYQLTIEENTAFYHDVKKQKFALPDENTSEAMYRATEAILKDAGLLAYEVSNYAKPGEASRHNLSYWQGDEYIGIGPGAHGRLNSAALTDRTSRIATQTLKSPERWLEQVERSNHGIEIWQALSAQEETEERVMMGLRLTEGLDAARFEQQTGRALFDCLKAGRRELYIREGLLTASEDRLQASLKGRLALTRLTAELLS